MRADSIGKIVALLSLAEPREHFPPQLSCRRRYAPKLFAGAGILDENRGFRDSRRTGAGNGPFLHHRRRFWKGDKRYDL
jgi:hypothetical protein